MDDACYSLAIEGKKVEPNEQFWESIGQSWFGMANRQIPTWVPDHIPKRNPNLSLD